VPEGGHVLGIAGTAPGLVVETGRAVVIVLPGPPPELKRLWRAALDDEAVRAVVDRAQALEYRILRVYGLSESAVARALAEAGGEREGVQATICAHAGEIWVELFGPGEALAADLKGALGDALFSEDNRSVEEIVLDEARERGLSVGTAESCTGGLVAARLTSVPGSSDVFRGGIVAYDNDVKVERLGVSQEILAAHGAVSAEAAAAMAQGAREALRADIAVSDTGIAGPGGATPEKPVGLVYLHAHAPGGEAARELRLSGDREAVRARAAAAALHLLRALLTQSRHTPV